MISIGEYAMVKLKLKKAANSLALSHSQFLDKQPANFIKPISLESENRVLFRVFVNRGSWPTIL
jgi:hypothetical protein